MEKQTGGTDLLTLAMRRAHAETAQGREPEPEPEPPPDDEDASATDTSEPSALPLGK